MSNLLRISESWSYPVSPTARSTLQDSSGSCCVYRCQQFGYYVSWRFYQISILIRNFQRNFFDRMPWQENSAVMIDRFDVRAHLDYIPDVNPQNREPESLSYEERQINYERYRILVQNDFFNSKLSNVILFGILHKINFLHRIFSCWR